jgi:hypothetical protein
MRTTEATEIVRLVDKIEDKSGPQAARQVLAFLSKLFNASRNDDFRSPIVRGMGRIKPPERAGTRVLTDEERDVWIGLNTAKKIPACYSNFARALSSQRRDAPSVRTWPGLRSSASDAAISRPSRHQG